VLQSLVRVPGENKEANDRVDSAGRPRLALRAIAASLAGGMVRKLLG